MTIPGTQPPLPPAPAGPDPWRTLALRVALVGALFSVVMAALLMVHALRDRASGPLAAAVEADPADQKMRLDPVVVKLQELRRQLAQSPQDMQLKSGIEDLDKVVRQRYFNNRAHVDRGAYMLLAALIVMMAALKFAVRNDAATPGSEALLVAPLDRRRQFALAARGVAIGGVVLAGALAFFAAQPMIALHAADTSVAASAHNGPPVVVLSAELAQNWPSFRGAGGDGIGPSTAHPADWDGPSGRGVLWKTEIALPGRNSPIVWKDNVFVCGASADEQEVYCVDAGTGQVRWSQKVAGPVAGSDLKPSDDTGYAAATMATDGKLAFAIFPTGDLVAMNFAGTIVWQKSLGKIESGYGYASSLAVAGNKLIVQLDQGSDPAKNLSALMAYDTSNGTVAWTARRQVSASWASPIVVHLDTGAVILTCATPLVMAHRADNGAEMWRVKLLGEDVAPSPTYAAGKVIVAHDPCIAAINIQSHGLIAASNLLWKLEEGYGEIPSPLATERFLFIAQSSGNFACYDISNGKKLWEHDLGAKIDASPALAGNVIYVLNRDGVMHMLQLGDTFKEIGTAALGEAVSASPAFAHGHIYLRGEHNLYCIGSKDGAEGKVP